MMQIFCIPYAGGNSSFFDQFEKSLEGKAECIKIEYSGRGSRKREENYQTFNDMIKDVASQINAKINTTCEVIIFGYSMGSLVGYEVIVNNLLLKKPVLFIAAAHLPPMQSCIKDKFSTLNDADLINKLKGFGGIDHRLLSNRRFWPMFLPQIRNDYRLLESYDSDKPKIQIDIKLNVLFAENDTPYHYVKEWSQISSKETKFYEFEGNHFFLKGKEQEISEIILNNFK